MPGRYEHLKPLCQAYRNMFKRDPSPEEFKRFYLERTSAMLKDELQAEGEHSSNRAEEWPWEEIVREVCS